MLWVAAAAVGLALIIPPVRARIRLSRAKHRSVAGHARLSRWLARLVPYYEYDMRQFFGADGAAAGIVERRRAAFFALATTLRRKAPLTLAMTDLLEDGISDLQFTRRYRVPFQFSRFVRMQLPVGSVVQRTDGNHIEDLDGNLAVDVSGSYGLNVFGYAFYKECIDAGIERVRGLGPLLGAYHPIVADNVERLRAISGMDEVSFHMSGTEAVMQAVRLARYHTGRSHVVQFCGASHGWWDGVQPGADVYVLKDMDEDTARVLSSRRDIACVLVNPLQTLHPNAPAPGDGTLVDSSSRQSAARDAYRAWLRRLRDICSAQGIPLIFDEVFSNTDGRPTAAASALLETSSSTSSTVHVRHTTIDDTRRLTDSIEWTVSPLSSRKLSRSSDQSAPVAQVATRPATRVVHASRWSDAK
jgi:glutamate-1-semialdehyde 2,1-aminomutase